MALSESMQRVWQRADTDSMLDNVADGFAELAKRKKPKVLVIVANPFGFGVAVLNRTKHGSILIFAWHRMW